MRIAHESIWVYDFTTLPPLTWSPHLRCTVASGALHRGFYNPSTTYVVPTPPLHSSFRRLTQGRRWKVALNRVLRTSIGSPV